MSRGTLVRLRPNGGALICTIPKHIVDAMELEEGNMFAITGSVSEKELRIKVLQTQEEIGEYVRKSAGLED